MKHWAVILIMTACLLVAPFVGHGQDNTTEVNKNEQAVQENAPVTDEVMPEDELSAGETTETEPTKKHLGTFELTFYSKEQFPNSKTSTGVYPTVGRTVAVDPKVIPYGTVIEIDGFGTRVAEDTGGAIKGNKLDIFVETTAEAFQYGRMKNVDVWIVE